MKQITFFFLGFIFLTVTGAASAQQNCEFNIIGTWKVVPVGATDSTPYAGGSESLLYRFAADGVVTVLAASADQSSEPREIASATYELDNPKEPKSIALATVSKNRVFLYGKSSIKIVQHTDASMNCVMPGFGPTRWVKVDANRYFMVLAARQGVFYDTSGPAFPILIKVAGRETQIDAVGMYSDQGKGVFGPVPPEAYQDFMREPRNDTEVMLRLEINPAQYERSLKILQTWARRVRENALLYPTRTALNNVLLVKAITETLNECGEEIKLYRLNYLYPEDWIAERYDPQFIPFHLFKELRRLNESVHVRDDKFQQATAPSGPQQGN